LLRKHDTDDCNDCGTVLGVSSSFKDADIVLTVTWLATGDALAAIFIGLTKKVFLLGYYGNQTTFNSFQGLNTHEQQMALDPSPLFLHQHCSYCLESVAAFG
jgi:hypothetical protein